MLAVSVIHFDSHHPAGRGVFHGSESRSAFLLGEARERQWHCWHLALPVEAAACRVGSGKLQRWQFPPFISVCTCLYQAHLPISRFLSSSSSLHLPSSFSPWHGLSHQPSSFSPYFLKATVHASASLKTKVSFIYTCSITILFVI